MTLIDADEFMSELKKYKYARKILAKSIINKINHYTDDDIITHAHWNWVTTRKEKLAYGDEYYAYTPIFYCSNCEMLYESYTRYDAPIKEDADYPKYCPNCGARMDEVINNE